MEDDVGAHAETCARGAGTHGDVLNVHTVTYWTDTRRRGTRGDEGEGVFIVSSAYRNLPTKGYHVLQRFTKTNHWILPILRMERGQHIPCTVLLDAHLTKQEGPRTKTTTTTTCRQQHTTQHHPPHHHTQPPKHPNTQTRAAHDMPRQHTTKKRHTRTRTCKCKCMCMCICFRTCTCFCKCMCMCFCTCRCSYFTEKRSLEHVPSMMCFVPSPLTFHNG